MSNISLNATDLWDTELNSSDFFKYLINNKTGEEGSFNWLESDTVWEKVPVLNDSLTIIIVEFNFSDATDSAEVEVNITVPPSEPVGDKSSTLYFTASLGE